MIETRDMERGARARTPPEDRPGPAAAGVRAAELDRGRLEETLGPDLAALVLERGAPLAGLARVATLPSPEKRRGAFRLELADGTRLKGRRFDDAEHAARVARLRDAMGGGCAAVIARRGDAALLEWVEGPTLDALSPLAPALLRRCGSMLGALHRAHRVEAAQAAPHRAEDLLEKLRRKLDALEEARRIEPGLARRALEAAERSRPAAPTYGIVHRDFCAENLVLRADGAPICIDDENIALGAHDNDLARTWRRWPMTREERARFVEGYEEHRPIAFLLSHFPFWATVTLVYAADLRFRVGAPGGDEALVRLARVLDSAEGAGGPAEAFWGA
jgi:hypothetical protein